MTETIQTAMDRLMTISAEPQDYVAEDGLLYCGSCNTPKEAFFPNGRKLFGRDRHPAECQCRQEARKKQEEEERARLHCANSSCVKEYFFRRSRTFSPNFMFATFLWRSYRAVTMCNGICKYSIWKMQRIFTFSS